MNELIEVLLEDVPCSNINNLINYLLITNRGDIEFSQNDMSFSYVQLKAKFSTIIEEIIKGYPLYIKLKGLVVEDFEIFNILMRVYFYENKYDIEISFDKRSMLNLAKFHKYFLSLKTDYLVKNVICGYEPAKDEETRFFTNKQLGPLNMT